MKIRPVAAGLFHAKDARTRRSSVAVRNFANVPKKTWKNTGNIGRTTYLEGTEGQ